MQLPPTGLSTWKLMLLAGNGTTRPRPLKTTVLCAVVTVALLDPSLPERLSIVAGQSSTPSPSASATAVTHPTVQLDPAPNTNCTPTLRRAASTFARCKPLWMDSAALRICEFCNQIAKLGAATASRIAMMAIAIKSSVKLTPLCLRIASTVHPFWSPNNWHYPSSRFW